MLDNIAKKRPTCADILGKNKWKILKNEIQKYGLVYPNFFENLQDNFFKSYFESRIILLNKAVETSSINIFRNIFKI